MHLSDARYPISKFLVTAKSFQKQPGEIYGTVYIILNLINKKKYVGSTTVITRRAGEYIRAAFSQSPSETRLVNRAIREEGIENFRMIKMIDCNSPLELAFWEIYFIRKYNTLAPNGYNESLNVSARVKPNSRAAFKQVTGIKHSADNRRKHSFEIIAINPELKEFYVCDSAALFGEVALDGIRRSPVSNACKGKTRFRGWYLYYNYIVHFSFDHTTQYSDEYIRATGILSGRGNYEYRSIVYALMKDSHQFLISNEYSMYELRYSDNADRYQLTQMTLLTSETC